MSIRNSTSIRDKFHSEIRAKQISEMMRLTRIRYIQQSHLSSVFTKLDHDITATANLSINMNMIQQLIKTMETYPQDQNTYTVIGNYLIYHEGAQSYFMIRVLSMSDIAKKFTSYHRLVLILLSKIQKTTSNMLQQFDRTISQIIQYSNEQNLGANLGILNIAMNFEYSQQKLKFIAVESIISFFKIINTFDLKKLKPQARYYIVTVCCDICSFLVNNQKHQKLIKDNIHQIIKVMTFGIDEYPKFRQQLIYLIKDIFIQFPLQLQEVFNTKIGVKCFQQLLYLCSNVPKLKNTILSIFKLMVSQFTFQIMQIFLNLNFHIVLVHLLKQPELNSPQQQQKILQILLSILNRIQQLQQAHILNRFLDQLDEEGFDQLLAAYMEVRRNQRIQKIITEIVDTYYSDQVKTS